MVRHPNELRIAGVVCAVAVSGSLLSGIMHGLRQDWMRMSLFFAGSVLTTFGFVSGIATSKAAARFRKIEDQLQQRELVLAKASPLIAFGFTAFMVITVAVGLCLAIVALFRRDGFGMGLYLTACGLAVVLCWGVSSILATSVQCKRLEMLISARQMSFSPHISSRVVSLAGG